MSKTIWIVNQYASTPEYGFAGRHYYLGKELAKLGYTVYLIASANHHLLRKRPQVNAEFLLEEIGPGFTTVWCSMPSYKEAHSKIRVLGWLFFSWKIRNLLKFIPEKPDVVICSSPSLLSFIGAKYIAQKTKSRLIFEVRDIWPLTLIDIGGYKKNNPFIKMLQWVEEKAYKESDKIVSNLENAIEHIEKFGVSSTKFTWVPNGFSLEEACRAHPLNESLLSQIPGNKFVIGYTGTIGVANALDILIYAADILRDYDDIIFVLIGDGKEKKSLKCLVQAKRLNNVLFLDSIPKVEVYSALYNFDVCYIGWLDDNLYDFGIGANKIPEYLFASKPIIHSYSGACDPVLETSSGLTVPAGSADELANAILTLYNTPVSEREKMGLNGRKAAIEKYEYSQLAKEYSHVLFD